MKYLLIVFLVCGGFLLGCEPSVQSVSPPGDNLDSPKSSQQVAGSEDANPGPVDSTDSSDEDLLDQFYPKPPKFEELFELPAEWKRLGLEPVWIDRAAKKVIVGGQICLRAGPLEMFACPQRTKEHESVVSVNTASRFVHAALLAVGAKPGTPVQFDPEYRAATGPPIKVSVRWNEGDELREIPAQQMVRDIQTRQPMQHDWLFVGSASWRNPDTNQEYYLADAGELICVSNFGSATMDLPVESSSEAYGLLFEAFTENIPPLGTPVLLILQPAAPLAEESLQSDGKNGATGE